MIELILVMAIIAIALMMAAPSLANFARGRGADDSAARFVALTHWARSQAISDGVLYHLNLDLGNAQWWLTRDGGGGSFVTIDSTYGQIYKAPDGIKMDSDAPQIDKSKVIEFDSTGRADPAYVRFTDARGNVVDVESESPTDMYHVVIENPGGR
jgi:Tfp pilus assembly protein FimT